jgi:hypothetical protein
MDGRSAGNRDDPAPGEEEEMLLVRVLQDRVEVVVGRFAEAVVR